MKSIYLIGSLRNPDLSTISNEIRERTGHEVFDDWFAVGPEADDYWKEYEESRGHTYEQALKGWAARHVFEFDKRHIDRCDIGVLIMPAGKSGHLELGYMIGQGKPGFILMDEPDRWDVMVQFASVHFTMGSLVYALRKVGQDVFGPVSAYLNVEQGPVNEMRDSDSSSRQDDSKPGLQWVPEGRQR